MCLCASSAAIDLVQAELAVLVLKEVDGKMTQRAANGRKKLRNMEK